MKEVIGAKVCRMFLPLFTSNNNYTTTQYTGTPRTLFSYSRKFTISVVVVFILFHMTYVRPIASSNRSQLRNASEEVINARVQRRSIAVIQNDES